MTEARARSGDRARRGKKAAPRTDPSHTLAVVAAGTLLTLVAFTVPLTTLAGTSADLHAASGAQAWVLSAMSLGAAAGLLSSGALGDDYGRRRTSKGHYPSSALRRLAQGHGRDSRRQAGVPRRVARRRPPTRWRALCAIPE